MPSCNPETIAEVIDEPSWTARARLVERIASAYVAGDFDALEVRSALEVFRVTLYDGEPLVRRVLAESLKHATALPRDIVLALAHDVADVATPFLVSSVLLDADDLAAIARDRSAAHRLAIACRAPSGGGTLRTIGRPQAGPRRGRAPFGEAEAEALLHVAST